MVDESIIQYMSGAGEEASFDTRTGTAWRGWETDDVTRQMMELQPIETVLWVDAMPEQDRRLCVVAADCLDGRAPTIQPRDDAEKNLFRTVWAYCAEMNGNKDNGIRIVHHPFVSSSMLGVFARDVFVRVNGAANDAAVISFTAANPTALKPSVSHKPLSVFQPPSSASPRSLLLAMQMCVLAVGKYYAGLSFAWPFVVSVADGADGQQFYDETGNAALMIALRHKTAWWKEREKTMPF